MTDSLYINGFFTAEREVDFKHAPINRGLYLFGSTNFNPHTMTPYYWVKIGYSGSMDNRLKQYNTHAPMYYPIDFTPDTREHLYQNALASVALARNGQSQEWYLVNRETYMAISNKGFAYFDKIIKSNPNKITNDFIWWDGDKKYVDVLGVLLSK